MSLNKVQLIGHLGKDPETKEIKGGALVCNLSVATTKRVQGQDRTEWHRVTCWAKTAEFAAKYLTKGRLVYVEGELQTRSWEQDGQKRYMTEVVASRLEALGPKGDGPRDEFQHTDVDPARGQETDDGIPF